MDITCQIILLVGKNTSARTLCWNVLRRLPQSIRSVVMRENLYGRICAALMRLLKR